ncbi:putative nucleotidyltransferase with HDIG domain [Nocardioides albertanoniae]|uniref:Putative nucleotidyltransferase with HDIG domain n=1 Tax=Nocardioides albertanoniae TaxID=1175486 RepID=A0A543A1K1_9ACTN|nr:HDIG domain-containing metalloprotein [Nocardioides albertanoniae]TQL66458.1 putative nucleotidyltransferase with HDIG domain [Nocardioides albertanoniae]
MAPSRNGPPSLGNVVAITASILVGAAVGAAVVVGITTSYADGNKTGPNKEVETGVGYVTDAEGIHHVPVEVDVDVETPPEWLCLPSDEAKARMACYIPVGDDNVTEDEVDRRIKEAIAQMNDDDAEVERQSVTVDSSETRESSPATWLTLFFAGLTSIVAAAGLAWTIFTQREHLRGLLPAMQRMLRLTSRHAKRRHASWPSTDVGRVPDLLSAAKDEAGRLVEPLGRRWQHLSAVGEKAEALGEDLRLDVELLAAACWLHDIGYAPELVDTGMHAIDGARHLRREGWDERIVSMVAHHSYAVLEAEERGLSTELSEFASPPTDYEDAVCFCDMTTGPDGTTVDAADRLDEIETRYGADHVVTRFIRRARPEILGAVARVRAARGGDRSDLA